MISTEPSIYTRLSARRKQADQNPYLYKIESRQKASKHPILKIIREVSEQTGIDEIDIMGESRKRKFSDARRLVCVVAALVGHPSQDIANHLSRHHSSVIHLVYSFEGVSKFFSEEFREVAERVFRKFGVK